MLSGCAGVRLPHRFTQPILGCKTIGQNRMNSQRVCLVRDIPPHTDAPASQNPCANQLEFVIAHETMPSLPLDCHSSRVSSPPLPPVCPASPACLLNVFLLPLNGPPEGPSLFSFILSVYRPSPSDSGFFKMTALNSADLSNILCLFRLLRTSSRVDLTSILAWNKEFEFSPSEQHEDPKPPWAGILNLNSRRDPIYALRFSEKPKKDGTWVFGSLDGSRNDRLRGTVPTGKDQSRCDFQLSPSHVGSNISRSHFSIELAPRVRRGAPVIIPRLKCLKGSVAVNHVNDPDHPALLNPGDELLLDQPTNILCAALQLQVWAPTLTPEELAEQRTTANEFERDIATALPGFFPGIRSGVDTRHGNTRVGLESGNFYVCFEEKAPPNTSVVPSCVVWSGPLRLSATVPPIESRDSPGSVKSKVEGLMKAFKNGGCIRHVSHN